MQHDSLGNPYNIAMRYCLEALYKMVDSYSDLFPVCVLNEEVMKDEIERNGKPWGDDCPGFYAVESGHAEVLSELWWVIFKLHQQLRDAEGDMWSSIHILANADEDENKPQM